MNVQIRARAKVAARKSRVQITMPARAYPPTYPVTTPTKLPTHNETWVPTIQERLCWRADVALFGEAYLAVG